jgi:hypothetical protein
MSNMDISTQSEFQDEKKHWTLREYLALLSWFLKETMWRRKWSAAALVLLGFVAATLRVAAIVQIMVFVKAFSRNRAYTLGPFSFNPSYLIPLSLIAGGLIILASVLEYVTKRAAILLWFEHEKFCQTRILQYLNQPGSVHLGKWRDSTYFAIMQGLNRYSRYFGRLFRMSLGLPVLLCEFVVYTLALVYLSWPLACCVFLVLLLTLRFIVWGNKIGMSASVDFDAAIRQYSTSQRSLVQSALHAFLPSRVAVKWYDQALESPTHKSMRECLFKRLTVVNLVSMMNEISLSLILVLILLFFGYDAVRNNARWEDMVAFIVAARYAMNSFQKLGNSLTSINRFLPQVGLYRNLVTDLRAWTGRLPTPPATIDSETSEEIIFALSPKQESCIPGSAASVCHTPEKPFWLVTSRMPTPFDVFAEFEQCFNITPQAEAQLIGNLAWVTDDIPALPSVTLGEYLHMGIGDIKLLKDWVIRLGFDMDDSMTPQSMDVPLTDCWENWNPELRLVVQILAALNADRKIILLTRNATKLLQADHFGKISSELDDIIVIFEAGLTCTLQNAEEDANILVIMEGQYWGFGKSAWLEQNADGIRENLQACARNASLLEDDEDEEMFM